MGYFASNAFTTFTQCGRGSAADDSPFTYTNDSGVYEIINSVTVPVGTGASGASFYTSTGNVHQGNGQPFQMYLTANSLTGLNSNNTVTVSNEVPDDGAGKPNFAYLQNQTFTFGGLQVAPHSTIAFYIPFIDNLSQGYIYCTNNDGITGSITPLQVHTVSYNANGGTGAPSSQSKLEGEDLTLTTSEPSKSFTVTFDPDGGSVSPTSKSVACTFIEWNTNADGLGTSYAPGSKYTANVDVTLYAIWKNSAIGSLPTPTRANCRLHIWSTQVGGSTQVTSTSIVTSDMTIYAVWQYAVVLDGSGGIIVITDGTTVTTQDTVTLYKTHGQDLTIPANYSAYITDTTEGSGTEDNPGGAYTPSTSTQFSGWGVSSTTETVSYKPGSSYTDNSPITLYAIYDTNRYTVVFTDGYSGNILKQYDDVPQGTGVTPPPDPVREGFTFSGWLGNYSCIMSNTTIEAFWGFVPIWIRQKNKWVKYEPKES